MDILEIKGQILDAVERRKNQWQELAYDLYDHPETALQEFRSSAVLTEILAAEGFGIATGVAGMPTAFQATSGRSGPSFAILAEMDALPGLGHACGHNIVAAAAIGAAVALKEVLPADAARVSVLGTPAEEQGVGKVEMVKAGCFTDIDFALMVHPSSKRQVVKMYLGLAKVKFKFIGKAAHAAAHPEEGINALDAVITMFNAVNALRQQLRQDVRVHGIVTDGGIAPNIIPGTASCFFYVRAQDLDEVKAVKERVVNCARGAALAAGCGIEVLEDEKILAPLKVNWSFYDIYSQQLKFLGLEEANAPPDRNMGSSDIGNVSQTVPTIHPHVPIGKGIHIHTEDFARATVSEKGKSAVAEGAKAMALTIAELAFSPEARKKIFDEFNNSLRK